MIKCWILSIISVSRKVEDRSIAFSRDSPPLSEREASCDGLVNNVPRSVTGNQLWIIISFDCHSQHRHGIQAQAAIISFDRVLSLGFVRVLKHQGLEINVKALTQESLLPKNFVVFFFFFFSKF